jgi:protein ImuA
LSSPVLAHCWRADRLADATPPVWPTGHRALDAELPGGGWPAAGLTELLPTQPLGSGEWRLLAPALACNVGDLLCIAPPAVPYAPALKALGVAPERLVVIHAAGADGAWAAEQALRAGSCAAVLWWGDAAPAMLRRLHLAAVACPLFAWRPAPAQAQASPAPLRLAVGPAPRGRVALRAFKRRGPPMPQPLLLELPLPTAAWRWHAVEPPRRTESKSDALARRVLARVAA